MCRAELDFGAGRDGRANKIDPQAANLRGCRCPVADDVR